MCFGSFVTSKRWHFARFLCSRFSPNLSVDECQTHFGGARLDDFPGSNSSRLIITIPRRSSRGSGESRPRVRARSSITPSGHLPAESLSSPRAAAAGRSFVPRSRERRVNQVQREHLVSAFIWPRPQRVPAARTYTNSRRGPANVDHVETGMTAMQV